MFIPSRESKGAADTEAHQPAHCLHTQDAGSLLEEEKDPGVIFPPRDRSAKQHPQSFQTQKNRDFYVFYTFFKEFFCVPYTTNQIIVGRVVLTTAERIIQTTQ